MKNRARKITAIVSILCGVLLFGFVGSVFAADENPAISKSYGFKTVAYTKEEVTEHITAKTYPIYADKEGYLFAGWYNSEACDDEDVIKTESDITGTEAYAKFVSEQVLTIRAQVTGGLIDDNADNDANGAIRFVTTVDGLKYRWVGFDITYIGSDNNEKTKSYETDQVYTQLYAVNSISEVLSVTPEDAFCQVSQYFMACVMNNVPSSFYETEFTVTPYWITMDGTKVSGDTQVKTIVNGCVRDVVYVSDEGTDECYYGGSEANAYKTLKYALDHVNDGGIVYVKDTVTIDNSSWTENSKSVTIKGTNDGATVKFGDTDVQIGDHVVFEDVTLEMSNITDIYANGHDLKIASSVTVNNSSNVNVYGGSADSSVESTNLELQVGTYNSISGSAAGGVTGTKYIVVGNGVCENISNYDYLVKAGANGEASIVGNLVHAKPVRDYGVNITLDADDSTVVHTTIAQSYYALPETDDDGLIVNVEFYTDYTGTEDETSTTNWQDFPNLTNSSNKRIIPSTTGYYRLAEDVSIEASVNISNSDAQIYLDLNGYTITVADGQRLCALTAKGVVLNIVDSSEGQNGKIIGSRTGDANGGLIYVRNNQCQFNMFEGTLDASQVKNSSTSGFGAAVYVGYNGQTASHSPIMNVYGGTVKGGSYTKGGSIFVDANATLNLYGGEITGGSATNGGNVWVESDGKLNLYGGTISTGVASTSGGNVYAKGSMDMYNGTLTQGKANGTGGGNLYIAGSVSVSMSGGTISKGTATNGGNIYQQGMFAMNGGTIEKGEVTNTTKRDRNIFVNNTNSVFEITGGTIVGDVRIKNGASAKVGGTAKIENGLGYTNLTLETTAPILSVGDMKEGAMISVNPEYTTDFATEATRTHERFFNVDANGMWVAFDGENNTLVLEECEYWTDTTTLPSAAGNYRLVEDITNPATKTLSSGTVTLDLNGHTIEGKSNSRVYVLNQGSLNIKDTSIREIGVMKGNRAGFYNANNGGGMILINNASSVFNMYSGTLDASNIIGHTDYASYASRGAAIYAISDSSFNMYGGTIIGGTVGNGGSIYIKGSFNMSGGTIKGGTANVDNNHYDDQVMVDSENAFTMSGGTIDGGVWVRAAGSVTVTGTAKITNGQGKKNLTLGTTTDAVTMSLGDLADGANIGVNPLYKSNGVTFATNAEEKDLNYISSDDMNYTITLEETELKLYGWTSWTEESTLPSTTGYYRLANDIALSSEVTTAEESDIHFDLNGYKVTATSQRIYTLGTSSTLSIYDSECTTDTPGEMAVDWEGATGKGGVISLVNTGAELYLYSGKLNASGVFIDENTTWSTENEEQKPFGGAVYVGSGSKFTIYGGSVQGGYTYNGGAIYVNGSLDIQGGTIYGGSVKHSRNQDYNIFIEQTEADNTFVMSGGNVDGGVWIKQTQGAVLTGTAKIYNTLGSTNLTLTSDQTVSVGDLEDGAKIGVNPLGTTYFATDATQEDAQYFVADNGESEVVLEQSDKLILIQWTSTTTLPTVAGYYRLENDVTVSSAITITNKTIYLDLNGNTVTANNKRIYVIKGSSTLNIMDTSANASGGVVGIRSGYSAAAGLFYLNDSGATLNWNSGAIDASQIQTSSGAAGAAVYVKGNNTFNMYGGELKTNPTSYGGCVYVDANARFNMYGGSITGTLAVDGGVVFSTAAGDIPYLAGGINSKICDCDDGYQMAIMEGVTEEEFTTYCTNVFTEDNGYTQQQSNDINGSLFRTYTNGTALTHVYWTKNSEEARIIVVANATVLDGFTSAAVEGTATATLHQLEALNASGTDGGMGYIIRLTDGRFIVIDGGGATSDNSKAIYDYMNENKVGDNITIAAWFITHTHSDHAGAFVQFTDEYSEQVTLESILLNKCDTDEQMEYCEGTVTEGDDSTTVTYYTESVTTAISQWTVGNTKLYKPLTGQKYTFATTTIEILYTMSDFLPNTIAYESDGKGGDYNVQSVVSRIEIDTTEGVDGDTFFVMADTTKVACDEMSARYGEYLQSDYVQVSHHGIAPLTTGASCRRYNSTKEIYDLIHPTYAFWPTTQAKYDERSTLEVNAYLIGKINNSANHFIAGNGAKTIEFRN